MESQGSGFTSTMRWIHKALAALLFVSLVGCDHATKMMAKSTFEGAAPLSLVRGVLDLTYTENRGVAFSLLANAPEQLTRPLLVLSNLVVLLLLYFIGRRSGWTSIVDRIAFVLVAAGAIGNALDRAVRGYVIDFLHLHYWPVFNVADVLIVVGYAVFFIAHWRRKPHDEAAA